MIRVLELGGIKLQAGKDRSVGCTMRRFVSPPAALIWGRKVRVESGAKNSSSVEKRRYLGTWKGWGEICKRLLKVRKKKHLDEVGQVDDRVDDVGHLLKLRRPQPVL